MSNMARFKWIVVILSLLGLGIVVLAPTSPSTGEPGTPTPASSEEPDLTETPAETDTPTPDAPTVTPTAEESQPFSFVERFEHVETKPPNVHPDLEERESDPVHVTPIGWDVWYQDRNYDQFKTPSLFLLGSEQLAAFEDEYGIDVIGGVTPDYGTNGRPEFTWACKDPEKCGGQGDPRRVYEGEGAAQYYCDGRTCYAGYYKYLEIPAGQSCEFSAQFQGTYFSDPKQPDEYLTLMPELKVLSGRSLPLRDEEVVAEELFIHPPRQPYLWYGDRSDSWYKAELEFDAPGAVTIVLGARNNFPVAGNFYWDDVRVECQ